MRVILFCAASLGLATFAFSQVAGNAVDQQLASKVQNKLDSKGDLKGIDAHAEGGTITLTGFAKNFHAVVEAEHTARQVNGVRGVMDDVKVQSGTETVPDQKLQKQLADRLVYDRMGQGQTFNNLTVNVQDGVVTVGGQVRDYPDRDSALDIVEDTTGVRGVVDNIKVEPLSPMDDQIRLEAARRIYANPQLQRYAIDPAHPIRIVVDNGHVTLTGVVQSQVDKTVAANALAGINGIFSVTNNLVVTH